MSGSRSREGGNVLDRPRTPPTHRSYNGFTIDREWCGHPTLRFVVRRCGEFVSCHVTKADALAFTKGELS